MPGGQWQRLDYFHPAQGLLEAVEGCDGAEVCGHESDKPQIDEGKYPLSFFGDAQEHHCHEAQYEHEDKAHTDSRTGLDQPLLVDESPAVQ